MTLGKGRAEAIGDRDIARLADQLRVHPADLEAISIVESNGFGWSADGRMKILFEKHWFYKLVDKSKRTSAVRAGLARGKWISPSNGGYKDQNTTAKKYKLLEAAIAMDEEAAFQSISMGKFQIMGFNHKICGFTSAKQMFYDFVDSEGNQLRAFANFLNSKKLVTAIRQRDFEAIENGYNGGGLKGRYAKKMRRESDSLYKTKWAHYKRGAASEELSATQQKKVNEVVLVPDDLKIEPVKPSGGFWAVLIKFITSIFRSKS